MGDFVSADWAPEVAIILVQSRPMSFRPVAAINFLYVRSPTTTTPQTNQGQREAKMSRYTPSTDIPTASDIFLKTESMVKFAVRGAIWQGDGRPGNHDTACSGGQMEITDLKRGKMEKLIFPDP